MALHRIYVSELDPATLDAGGVLDIAGPEAHHAVKVKRLAAGDRLEVFNGRGLTVGGIVETAGKRSMAVRIESVRRSPRPVPQVTIAAPPPKGPRAESMIEQLSQVGASQWVPLMAERSVVEPRDKRVAKWRETTVVESAKQCGRAWLMDIDDPATLERCLESAGGLRLLVADATGRACAAALSGGDPMRPVLLFVGPEGGFSDAERETLVRAGAVAVSLGPHLMRIETAAVVGAAAIVQSVSPDN